MPQRHDISWIKAYGIALVSLLSGAAVVHNIFKPDLVMPDLHFAFCSDCVNTEMFFASPSAKIPDACFAESPDVL